MRVDLNSDLGESFGPWKMGDDEAMLGIVTSASVACGWHAGDPVVMHRACEMAKKNGVAVPFSTTPTTGRNDRRAMSAARWATFCAAIAGVVTMTIDVRGSMRASPICTSTPNVPDLTRSP